MAKKRNSRKSTSRRGAYRVYDGDRFVGRSRTKAAAMKKARLLSRRTGRQSYVLDYSPGTGGKLVGTGQRGEGSRYTPVDRKRRTSRRRTSRRTSRRRTSRRR